MCPEAENTASCLLFERKEISPCAGEIDTQTSYTAKNEQNKLGGF